MFRYFSTEIFERRMNSKFVRDFDKKSDLQRSLFQAQFRSSQTAKQIDEKYAHEKMEQAQKG